jgi:hypothetical protein
LRGHFKQIAETKKKTTISTDETCYDEPINTIVPVSAVSFMGDCWLRPLWLSPSSFPCTTIVITNLLDDRDFVVNLGCGLSIMYIL